MTAPFLDQVLLASVKELQQKAAYLSEAERKFCAQKLKWDFLLNGDKGTKIFHFLIKGNAKRNFIASLTKRDGSRTTSKEEIQDEFLSFYVGLLGTKQDSHGFNKAAVEDGLKITP